MQTNRNEKQTIGTIALVVSKDKENSGSKRINITITNTSSSGQNITLAIDAEAKDKEGIYLSPGGYWSDSQESGYTSTQKMITAISDAAGGIVSIQERLI